MLNEYLFTDDNLRSQERWRASHNCLWQDWTQFLGRTCNEWSEMQIKMVKTEMMLISIQVSDLQSSHRQERRTRSIWRNRRDPESSRLQCKFLPMDEYCQYLSKSSTTIWNFLVQSNSKYIQQIDSNITGWVSCGVVLPPEAGVDFAVELASPVGGVVCGVVLLPGVGVDVAVVTSPVGGVG